MKNLSSLLAAFILAAAPLPASAVTIFSSSVGGMPIGNTFITFDEIPLGNGGGMTGGVNISFTGNAQTVEGSKPNFYAAPVLSGGNGAAFGQPDGKDMTRYLSSGTGSVELTLANPSFYLGLLWGSVDKYNSLTFYSGATLLGNFTGADVAANPDGLRDASGTYYVNIVSTDAFDRVVVSGSEYAFELDNLSWNMSNVPEGGSTIVLMGSVVGGLMAMRRAGRR